MALPPELRNAYKESFELTGYAAAPVTIGELRAQKTDDCNDWTPRELLLKYLRRIDSGEFVPDGIVVLHVKHDSAQTLTGMQRSKMTVIEAVALCEMAKHDLLG